MAVRAAVARTLTLFDAAGAVHAARAAPSAAPQGTESRR
jgi:hypothetical protein